MDFNASSCVGPEYLAQADGVCVYADDKMNPRNDNHVSITRPYYI